MRNLSDLLVEKNLLITELKNTLTVKDNIENEIKEVKRVNLLNTINSKYKRIREIAQKIWECEIPNEDVICSDGSFHKTKIKKYPKLASLKHTYVKESKGNLLLKISCDGETFDMYIKSYESNKPTVYTRPENFHAFLEENTIPLNDITLIQYDELTEKINQANKELNQAIENYSKIRKELKIFQFETYGLIETRSIQTYQYNTKNQ
jgi:chaperonin cofactor prefoldin